MEVCSLLTALGGTRGSGWEVVVNWTCGKSLLSCRHIANRNKPKRQSERRSGRAGRCPDRCVRFPAHSFVGQMILGACRMGAKRSAQPLKQLQKACITGRILIPCCCRPSVGGLRTDPVRVVAPSTWRFVLTRVPLLRLGKLYEWRFLLLGLLAPGARQCRSYESRDGR